MSPRLVLIRNEDGPAARHGRRTDDSPRQAGSPVDVTETAAEADARRELERMWWWAGL